MTHTTTADFSMDSGRTAAMPKKSRLAEVFGELADPKFYLHLLKVAIAEVIKAAVLTFAGTVAWYVQSKISMDRNTPQYSGGNSNVNQSAPSYMGRTAADESRERQYIARSQYSPSSYAGPKTEVFPGFGDR